MAVCLGYLWSFQVADLSRTGKKCTEVKNLAKGMQSVCFSSLNMQNLRRCCCRRVVDLKLLNYCRGQARMVANCMKMKIARAKLPKLLFLIVKYGNFGTFLCTPSSRLLKLIASTAGNKI